MATQVLTRGDLGRPLTLGSAQTGNGTTTDIIDRGKSVGPALLEFVTTVGATPTITIQLEGSNDGTNFFPIPYQTTAAPGTIAVATFAITSATTTRVFIPAGYAFRFLRVTRSANTNVTITTKAYLY